MRRVVVTGLGMVCPIGNDVKTSWENALAGQNGIGGLGMICDNYLALHERGARRVSPFMIPGTIINMISGQLSIMFGL